MLTSAGEQIMVGFSEDSIGLALNPPAITDGDSPIPYVDLTPDEADYLAQLLIYNAKQCRAFAAEFARRK